MNHLTTVYSPLDGTEIKRAILDEISQQLDLHPDLARNISYPRMVWKWNLTLEPHPEICSNPEVEIEGEIEVKPKLVDISKESRLGIDLAPQVVRESLKLSEPVPDNGILANARKFLRIRT